MSWKFLWVWPTPSNGMRPSTYPMKSKPFIKLSGLNGGLVTGFPRQEIIINSLPE